MTHSHMIPVFSAFVLAAFLLSGCASKADQEVQRIQALARDGIAREQSCTAAIAAKPKYAHLYLKFAALDNGGKPSTPTPIQLADTETVSDDDISSGLDWYAEDEACGRDEMDILGKIDPELLIIHAQTEQQATSLVREIGQGKLTYGAVNSRIVDIRRSQIQSFAQWARKLRARLDAMRQQERIEHEQFMAEVGAVTEALATAALTAVAILGQQQALAAQAQVRFAQAHPVYVPAYRITTTNCRWIGSIWSCTSF